MNHELLTRLDEIETNMKKLADIIETLVDANRLVAEGVKRMADTMLDIHKIAVDAMKK